MTDQPSPPTGTWQQEFARQPFRKRLTRLPNIAAAALALAALFGILAAAGFAIPPLARAREIAPAGLFRDLVSPSGKHGRWPYRAAAIVAFWQQQIFSGRDVPPAEKASEKDVIAYVKDHEGAVGYVSPDVELPVGVKTLVIEGLRP